MSEIRRVRLPNSVGISCVKSLTNGTSGLTTTISFAPASTAMSRFVVETIPPSTSSRSLTSTGWKTIGSAVEARTAVEIGTSSQPVGAEHDPLAGVEVGGRQVELDVELTEVVGAVGVGERLGDVLLDARAGVEPGRQQVGERDGQIDGREPRQCAADLARHAEQMERKPQALRHELAVVGSQQHVERHVAERRRHLVVDHPHHLLRRDAVGRQRGDQRARARADVDVELVDGPVDGQQVERAQRADLVDAAGEAAAAQHEGGL